MLPFKLVYDPKYDLNLGAHVFPSQKYRLVHDKLLADGIAAPDDFLAPSPAADADILRVHSQDYVYKLKNGSLTPTEILRMEVPYSKELVNACWLAAGGSILAAQRALIDGLSANIGGGFHHAYADHGEGFCVIHDVAVAIRRLQFDRAIQTAMVVDTDVHQGNGTASIFGGDGDVFTLSIHQEHNYPYPKPPSTVDVDLPDGIGDEDYLIILERNLREAFRHFTPQILFYMPVPIPIARINWAAWLFRWRDWRGATRWCSTMPAEIMSRWRLRWREDTRGAWRIRCRFT
jgi:acetoin utilization deacetylase AcuC-like enzyme